MILYLLDKLVSLSGSLETVDFSSITFEEKFNIKDQVLPIIFGELIAQLESKYPFLEGYDISSMTYEEMVNEIIALAAAAALFEEMNSVVEDINNINNIDPATIQEYFKYRRN